MTNAATISTIAPVSKLYKMCKWGSHKACKGHFETYSVCSCACHKPAKPEAKPARVAKVKATAAVREFSKPVVAAKPEVARVSKPAPKPATLSPAIRELAEWMVKRDAYMAGFTPQAIALAESIAKTLA